jgi:hypothetical protein
VPGGCLYRVADRDGERITDLGPILLGGRAQRCDGTRRSFSRTGSSLS